MGNTGFKRYRRIIEVYADNGKPTGRIKDNDPNDVDYIQDVYDINFCPIISNGGSSGGNEYTLSIKLISGNYEAFINSDNIGESYLSLEDTLSLAFLSISPLNQTLLYENNELVEINILPGSGTLSNSNYNFDGAQQIGETKYLLTMDSDKIITITY